jgi:hypothetical protein
MARSPAVFFCALALALSGAGVAQAASGGSLPALSGTAPPPAHTGASPAGTAGSQGPPTVTTNPESPIPVAVSNTPPVGRRLSSARALEIARALPKMRAVRAKYRGSYGGAYLKGPVRWQVSFFSANGKKEIGQVIIADGTGRVLEQWTGFQVAWTMARGYPGAFGRHVNALYIWLALCLLFMLPFVKPRRPLSLLHFDLLVLLSFSVSLAFFNHGDIDASVPLVYPPLLYVLARMLAIASPRLRHARASAPAPVRRPDGGLELLVPVPWLALGLVFLIAFRITLNVADSNVIDVGYAGVIGAQRLVDGKPLYGGYPADNEHGDTYGPVNYAAYVPFEQVFGWSGTWDDLPAAHAAAIFFDLLSIALLFLLGRRVRGPTLGLALAYAWAAYPFTLFAMESNSNDSLVAALVLAALLAAGSAPARGAFAALAGLTKFAPLAIAPVLATHALPVERRARVRSLALFTLAFSVTVAVVAIPALSHDSLHTVLQRTIIYQDDRGSPFSVWGLYGGLGAVQTAVQIAAVALAIALAVLPRRGDVVGLAAACAAVLVAVQLGIEHWFYLYIPWFFAPALLALLGAGALPRQAPAVPDVASGSARSNQLAGALSS